MKADLHIHSFFSDGSDDIDKIIVTAMTKGLDAVAITDHDTFSHASRIPSDAGIKIITGIEISAIHRETGTRAHMLGYNIEKPGIITAYTQPLLEARSKNSEKQAAILIREGYKLDMDKLARAGGKYLYKSHIMDQLVETGQASEIFGEFFKRVFRNGGICDFDIEYIDVFEAVRAIKEAGGLAVLAHPGQQRNLYLIQALAGHGLDGIELNHHANSPENRTTILDYANRYGLFLTGGSDYHGRFESHHFGIGDFLSEESGALAVCRAQGSA